MENQNLVKLVEELAKAFDREIDSINKNIMRIAIMAAFSYPIMIILFIALLNSK